MSSQAPWQISSQFWLRAGCPFRFMNGAFPVTHRTSFEIPECQQYFYVLADAPIAYLSSTKKCATIM